jgi:TP901 family phage tail tape measure protein
MVEAATEFRKNGFNDQDSARLAEITAIFQNVSDEATSASDAASIIISQLIAFGHAGEDATEYATHFTDAMNEVANSFSVSTGALAKGLAVAASSSSAMGNSLEETIGLITAMTEVTRNANKSSRGLSTIMANLAQVLDGTSSNGEKINKIFKDLGVSMSENGQLKSGYDLLEGLAGKWGDLNSDTQKYIATTIAGATQLNNFLALMNNFSHAAEATSVALNSTGSAAEENARYMGGLEARTQALKQEFEDLSNNVIPNETVAAFLSLGKTILGVANSDIGVFLTRFGLIAGAVVGGGNIVLGFVNKIKTMTAALGAASGAAAGLQAALGWIGIALGVVAAVLPSVIDAWNESHKSVSELAKDFNSFNQQLQTNKERLEEIAALPWTDRTADINKEYLALKQQNDELERNKVLTAEQLLNAKKFERIQTGTAYDVFAPSYDDGFDYGATAGQIASGTDTGHHIVRNTKEALALAEELRKKGLEPTIKTVETYANTLVEVSEELQKYNDILDKTGSLTEAENANLTTTLNGSQEYYSALVLMQKEGRALNEEQKQFIKLFQDTNKSYQDADAAASTFGVTLNRIKEISPDLYKYMEQNGFTVNTFSEYCKNASIDVMTLANTLVASASAWGSYSDAATAGFANIMTQTEFMRHGTTRRQYGTYGDYLAAMQQKYMGQGAADIRQKFLDALKEAREQEAKAKPTAAQQKLQKFQEQVKALDHQLAMNQISTESYYASLQKLMNQYLQDAENQETLWKYEEKIYAWRTKKDEELAKKRKEETIASLQKELDVLEQQKSAVEELYDAKNKALENSNKMLERQLKLEELIQDIADARAKKILVFRNGRFEYTSDTEAISAAKKNYNQYLQEIWREDEQSANETARDLAVAAIEAKIARQQERISKAQSGYASGTLYSSAGLHLVGENGPELRVMGAGEGILPADITKNLWDWGLVSPKDIVSNLQAGVSGGLSFNNVTMSFPSVHNANDANGFVEQLVNLAYQRAYKRI